MRMYNQVLSLYIPLSRHMQYFSDDMLTPHKKQWNSVPSKKGAVYKWLRAYERESWHVVCQERSIMCNDGQVLASFPFIHEKKKNTWQNSELNAPACFDDLEILMREDV